MLEFYSENERLDLPDEIEVNLTFENPFLSQDRIPFTYSIPFNLPATSTNMRKFKHPKRLASIGSWDAISSFIRFNGITFSQGSLTLTEVEKTLSTSYLGVLANDLVKKMMNGLSAVVDFFYSFGSGSRLNPDFDTGWANLYKNTIDANSKDIGIKFAACPVRIQNEQWYGESASFGNYNATKLYLNMWNVSNGSYLFTDAAEPVHGVIYPQPYIHYLFAKVFGDALNVNFFSDNSELKTLCMLTTYHKMYSDYIMSHYQGILIDNPSGTADNYMYLNSFFNKYAFNNFLKDILKMFCCSLIPRSDGKVDIIHNQSILESTDIIDWSDKLVGSPNISIEKGKRYDYGYQSEITGSEDEYHPLLDSIDELLLGTTAPGIYQISTTGEIYEKVDESSYKLLSSNLGGNTSQADDDVESFNMNSASKPISMKVDEYWWLNSNIIRGNWYIPEFPGAGDRYKNDSAPYLAFNRGYYNLIQKVTETSPAGYISRYPLLTPYVRDMAGNKVGNYSLAWEGPDGLIAKFHSGYKAYVEKDKHILKGNFLLTELDLKNINYEKKYHVRGMNYFVEKIEVILKKKSISLARVKLVES